MFFVISGYVITLSLLRQLKNGKFSSKFLRRRMYRLFPSLLVIFLTNVFVMLLFTKSDKRDYAVSAIMSSISLSNIYFWLKSDYFDTSAIEKQPLLHTWSLSVEGQFYISWSLLVFVLYYNMHSKKRQLLIMILLLVASLLLSEATVHFYPSAAFYNIPFLYFEFLFRAIPAWYKESNGLDGNRNNEMRKGSFVLLLIGLIIMVSLFTLFHRFTTFFPGISAIPVCLATIVTIQNCSGNIIGFCLTNRFNRFLGSISYSVYLTHWPLLTLLEPIMPYKSTMTQRLGAIALSMTTGFVLNVFVEVPFQENRNDSCKQRNLKKTGILVGDFIATIFRV